MVAEFPEKNTSFLFTCKENYFLGIYPADNDSIDKPGYKALVQIAKAHFDAGLHSYFMGYFREGRYLIQLWAAHLILEYGCPERDLETQCIEVIQEFIANFSTSEIAEIQKDWLDKYWAKK